MKQLEYQKKEVIKPLMFEVKVKDEIIKRMKSELDTNIRDLKMLNTIVRIPTMCQEF